MRGPKPKPTALKIIQGVRRDRIGQPCPVAPLSTPDPPDWLEGAALEHWNELAPILIAEGILTIADRTALAMMCDDFGTMREADDLPEIHRYMSKDEAREIRAIRRAADHAADSYLVWLREFGMTPASRSRAQRVKPVTDSLSAFLNDQC